MNFEDHEIPEEWHETLYFTVNIDPDDCDCGEFECSTYDKSRWNSCEHLLVHEEKVKVKIPKVKINFKEKIIEVLEEKKTDELARHEVEMNEIQNKIDSLLAIEYQPVEAA